MNLGVKVNDTVKKWHKNERIDIPCPDIIMEYNEGMGGVDLTDMLISLYYSNIKSK